MVWFLPFIKSYLRILILFYLFTTASGFINYMLYPLANFFLKKYFIKFVEPAADLILFGPSGVVTRALMKVTPFLSPSLLGEHLDSIILNFALGMIGFLANVISKIIENTVSYSLQGLYTGLAVVSVLFGEFFEFIFRTLSLLTGEFPLGASLAGLLRKSPSNFKMTISDLNTTKRQLQKVVNAVIAKG